MSFSSKNAHDYHYFLMNVETIQYCLHFNMPLNQYWSTAAKTTSKIQAKTLLEIFLFKAEKVLFRFVMGTVWDC